MIRLTRGDGREIVLNAELIQYIDSTPDTIITLTTDQKIIVKEAVNEVVKRVIAYKRQIASGPLSDR